MNNPLYKNVYCLCEEPPLHLPEVRFLRGKSKMDELKQNKTKKRKDSKDMGSQEMFSSVSLPDSHVQDPVKTSVDQ